jgi:hypothetical protein
MVKVDLLSTSKIRRFMLFIFARNFIGIKCVWSMRDAPCNLRIVACSTRERITTLVEHAGLLLQVALLGQNLGFMWWLDGVASRSSKLFASSLCCFFFVVLECILLKFSSPVPLYQKAAFIIHTWSYVKAFFQLT